MVTVKNKVQLFLTLLLLACRVQASILVDESHVVAANGDIAASLPAAKNFTVTSAGDYTLTLTDIGKQSGGATSFTSLSLVITQGSKIIKQVSVPEGTVTATSVSATVTLSMGSYTAQVLGVTTGASLYAVSLVNDSAQVLSLAGAVTIASSSSNDDFSSLNTTLNLVAGHSYSVTLHDLAFPASLEDVQSSIVIDGGVQCKLSASTSGSCSFVAGATNQLFAVATKSTGAVAGVYSIKIVDGANSNIVLSSIYPVGNLPAPVAVALPATTGYQLSSTDLKTPDPLSNLQVMLLQGIDLLAVQSAAGMSNTSSFNDSARTANLYVVAAGTSNGGIYGVQITQGSSIVYSNASVVTTTSTPTQSGYYFTASAPVAGNYVLSLSDINFPQSFASLSAKVTQNGVSLGTLSASGTLMLNNVVAGNVQIYIVANPGASGQGLFGLTVAASGSTNKLLNVTQGVGQTFLTIPVNVATAGTYRLNVNDFLAPQHLGQILVAVTRDTQFVGEVIGSGAVNVDATAGSYVLNVIADTDSVANASLGMYGISFASAPSLTLTASATTVTAGGTVTLSWISTDATSCTASDDWSGSKAVADSTVTGAITADSKFTLTCSGLAGNVSQSVNVQVKAAQSSQPADKSGGGGAMQWWFMALLIVMGSIRKNIKLFPLRRHKPEINFC